LSFVLGITSTRPRSSLPTRGEVSRAVCFTHFPQEQGGSGITTHPAAVLSAAQPETSPAKLRARQHRTCSYLETADNNMI